MYFHFFNELLKWVPSKGMELSFDQVLKLSPFNKYNPSLYQLFKLTFSCELSQLLIELSREPMTSLAFPRRQMRVLSVHHVSITGWDQKKRKNIQHFALLYLHCRGMFTGPPESFDLKSASITIWNDKGTHVMN